MHGEGERPQNCRVASKFPSEEAPSEETVGAVNLRSQCHNWREISNVLVGARPDQQKLVQVVSQLR